jgi:hypothetical protein
MSSRSATTHRPTGGENRADPRMRPMDPERRRNLEAHFQERIERAEKGYRSAEAKYRRALEIPPGGPGSSESIRETAIALEKALQEYARALDEFVDFLTGNYPEASG